MFEQNKAQSVENSAGEQKYSLADTQNLVSILEGSAPAKIDAKPVPAEIVFDNAFPKTAKENASSKTADAAESPAKAVDAQKPGAAPAGSEKAGQKAAEPEKSSREGEPKSGSDSAKNGAHDRLEKVARDAGLGDKFMKSMADFEKVYTGNDLDKIYGNVEKLLSGAGTQNPHLNAADRARLAQSMMQSLAHPEQITQIGAASVPATLEHMMARKHPVEYSGMIKDVGLSGKFTSPDGISVTLPKPDAAPPKSTSYSSQLFLDLTNKLRREIK
jgi:hypothetical protein